MPPTSRGRERKYHRSLRISSLDPSAPKAEKDCRVCSRRRIRCDRSLPTCKKCELRKVECPAYGLTLKWIPRNPGAGADQPNVAAVEQAPSSSDLALRPELKATPAEAPRTPSLIVRLAADQLSRSSLPLPDTISFSTLDSVPRTNTDGASPCLDVVKRTKQPDEASKHRYGLDLTLLLSPLPDHLQDSSVRRLLDHYDHSVAATMVWVDSPENPWRNIMLPLAIESPPLLLSMLALSAEHLSARMRSNTASGSEAPNLSRKYRDNSLELLARQLRHDVRAGSKDGLIRRGPANSTLATMLMQCNLEMVQPSSDLWRLHLKAARTMIQRWASMSHASDGSDSTSKFLLKEVFMIDAFASTTVFGEEDELPGVLPKGEDCTIFTEYLQVVREVTATERQRYNASILSIPPVDIDIQDLRQRFEYTRARTLRFSRRLHFGSEAMRRDFNRIVEIFHHAGLIYSYQALVNSKDIGPENSFSLQCLFDTLRLFSDSPAFAQDIVWPLFIAGTESRGRTEEQMWIEKRLLDAMKSTGFSNCQQALEFLQSFWVTDPGTVGTWIQFAREYVSVGKPFLVF